MLAESGVVLICRQFVMRMTSTPHAAIRSTAGTLCGGTAAISQRN
jgi:hypothetical protein